MRKIFTQLLTCVVLIVGSLQSNAQCDQTSYSDLSGPCASSVCGYDPFCCNTEWDSFCAGEAASDPACVYCWTGCHDNDLDGFTNCDGDCDDFDDTIYPGASDLCSDGVDQDCNGAIDDGGCDQSGYSNLSSPCAINVCGYDPFCCNSGWDIICAGEAIADPICQSCLCGCYDNDLDTYTNCDGDCNDFDSSIYPGAPEICSNNVDEDCNGLIDDLAGACDNPGYSDFSGQCGSTVCGYDPFCCNTEWDLICASEAAAEPLCTYCLCGCYDNDLDGYTNCDGDCDDFDETINPGMAEICNDLDDNCDFFIDEGLTFLDYYSDDDQDGFGAIYLGNYCAAPAFSSTLDGDCDDNNSDVNPGAMDICSNDIDEDCSGNVDDALGNCDVVNYFESGSSCAVEICSFDPFCCSNSWDLICVSEAIANNACSYCLCGCYDQDLDGFTNCDGDCNDNDATIYPGASEICNGIDEDCNGSIDEGLATATYYFDEDLDGYGGSTTYVGCSAPPQYSTLGNDCDDNNNEIYPGAFEFCNETDDDCDLIIDNGTTQFSYFIDNDGDGYGDPSIWISDCSAPTGYVADDSDCDDSNSAINISASEQCNDIDDDCDGSVDDNVPFNNYYRDADGDTYGDPEVFVSECSQPLGYVVDAQDCDDTDNTVNPGESETCNDVDDDCNGNIDDNLVLFTYYLDSDDDGFGDITFSVAACAAPIGYVADNSDCNDSDDSINPGMSETCDGEDEDCDGSVDDNVTFTNFYLDSDNDGYGNPTISVNDCIAPFGYVNNDSDCDDADENINPGAIEICNDADEDCDGDTDEELTLFAFYADTDGDGYGDPTNMTTDCSQPVGYVTDDTDCDDADENINPGAAEICNNADEDCDGNSDEELAVFSFYADTDGDGYGDPLNMITDCSQPVGFVTDDSDCDDTDENINPAVSEVCNNADEDCDGLNDEGIATELYFADIDDDGYGDPLNSISSCMPMIGYTTDSSDCDDTDASVNPGANESCNGSDDNCNGSIDEGLSLSSFYADNDNDGYGNENDMISACVQPLGYTTIIGDCDDTDDSINPGASEVCDDVDQDCDGDTDEDLATFTFYADADGDGYGDSNTMTSNCSQPTGYVTDDSDCDDNNANINPDASEICDNTDNDCDGLADDGVTLNLYFADSDNDGFGDLLSTTESCSQPAGYVSNSDDCDDTSSLIYPGGIEYCNGIDDDCDGNVDNDVFDLDYFADIDGDGYGSEFLGAFCLPQSNASTTNGDCDDNNSNVYPGASESCNTIDDDCDGSTDEDVTYLSYFSDADGDGFGLDYLGDFCSAPLNSSLNDLDCNDSNTAVNPDATEICNTIDDDCDGIADDGLTFADYYQDLDGDGFGELYLGNLCEAPPSSAINGGDCDDADAAINPGTPDVCNSIDDDCSGQIDDGLTYSTYYSDADGDGFGSSLLGDYCEAPLSSSLLDGDCDDGDANVYPGATEICNDQDDDCDTAIDNGVAFTNYFEDLDDDGYGDIFLGNFCVQPIGSVMIDGDCDDQNASVNPGISEICNDIDDDCNESIDDGLFISTYYLDEDNDGFGSTLLGDFCSPPANSALTPGDCDDSSSSVNPLEDEQCNNIDDDCDGSIDDEVVYHDYYSDADNDGYGNEFLGNFCVVPANSSTVNGDCDDNNNAVNPGAAEVCNDLDDNCNEGIDEGLEVLTYYLDADGDGFGFTLLGDFCSPPASSSVANGDCDDDNSEVNPIQPEFCNEIDDNCDGNIDENVVYQDYFSDMDGDGYGSTFLGNFCLPPANSTTASSDCDDNNAAVYPSAFEFCNLIDDDCDGLINEGLSTTVYYQDNDGDAVGGALLGSFCYTPENSSTVNGDCDDEDNTIYPGATELCNNIDDNCDGNTDEGAYNSYFADADNDGYGDYTQLVEACDQPLGYVANQDDCNDLDPNVNPVAVEYCNLIDDDCDGIVDDDCINSVDEIQNALSIQLYPNPVKEQLSVQLSGAYGTAECMITDAVGKIVSKTNITTNNATQTIDCSNLSQGSYTITVTLNNLQVHKQFMKL